MHIYAYSCKSLLVASGWAYIKQSSSSDFVIVNEFREKVEGQSFPVLKLVVVNQ